MPTIRIVGIGLTEEEAITDPKSSLIVDSCDTLYAGCEILHNGIPFALQPVIDGNPVDSKDTKNSSGKYKRDQYTPYSIDVSSKPVMKGTHTIQFLIGEYQRDQFIEKGKSAVFELIVGSQTSKSSEQTSEQF